MNTSHAAKYWGMRLSVDGSAKDAQVQSGILLSDFTSNLVVGGRLPYPEPNFASYVSSGRPNRLAVALLYAAWGFWVSPFLLVWVWLSFGFALSSSLPFYFA